LCPGSRAGLAEPPLELFGPVQSFREVEALTDCSSLGDALSWLDGHQNLERMLADVRSSPPDLGRMRKLVDLLGHPERTYRGLHVTGTNGKTSTARAAAALLEAKGLRVGLFTSPHLERINERIVADGFPISDAELAAVLGELALLEPMMDQRPTWFELMTAAALMWFADRPVDVAVVEVGMGGRFDATNVVDADVAMVTNIGLDHLEFLGPTRLDVAWEKAGVVKPGSLLVLGETDPELYSKFAEQSPSQVWLAGRDYCLERNDLAVGGRLLDLRTPLARYEDLWLDLHGSHQGANFAAAVAGVEGFFGHDLGEDLVRRVAGSLRSPGRLELVGRDPLVLLDGAKNLEGARAAGLAVEEEFGKERPLVLVVGMLKGKDPEAMLCALGAQRAKLVVACPAPSPRSLPPEAVVEAASRLGATAASAPGVQEALELALGSSEPEDLVLVAGSLYVVGAARRFFPSVAR